MPNTALVHLKVVDVENAQGNHQSSCSNGRKWLKVTLSGLAVLCGLGAFSTGIYATNEWATYILDQPWIPPTTPAPKPAEFETTYTCRIRTGTTRNNKPEYSYWDTKKRDCTKSGILGSWAENAETTEKTTQCIANCYQPADPIDPRTEHAIYAWTAGVIVSLAAGCGIGFMGSLGGDSFVDYTCGSGEPLPDSPS